MAFFVKKMISDQVKNLGFSGSSEETKEGGGSSDPAAAQGMTREEYEEYQKQVIEENPKFPVKKVLSALVQNSPVQPEGQAELCRLGLQEALLWLLVNQRMERDAAFTHRKAERACLRVHLREKYRLPTSEMDENQIQMAGDDVDLPEDLRKMVDEDEEEEEDKDSILRQLQNLQNMDLETIREKAQATLMEMKQSAEQRCCVM